MLRAALIAIGLVVAFAPGIGQAANLCTFIADAATGATVHENGDCQTRITPASTFKVPLALMGYDSGFLKDTQTPYLPYKDGDASWGGKEWKQRTTPLRWMKYSVVWYSWAITRQLGLEGLISYTRKFDYGNADLSGDKFRPNALEWGWISSSLKISPREQVAFMRKLLRRELPVSQAAIANTLAIVECTDKDGWRVCGKTGSAFPRNRDGNFNRARGWGWFVGWASKDGRTLVFARLDQDERRHETSGGLRARKAFLESFPGLAR